MEYRTFVRRFTAEGQPLYYTDEELNALNAEGWTFQAVCLEPDGVISILAWRAAWKDAAPPKEECDEEEEYDEEEERDERTLIEEHGAHEPIPYEPRDSIRYE